MNRSTHQNYFRTGMVFITFLFLWSIVLGIPFSQNSGGVVRAGQPPMEEISGKVVKTMNGGGYTYALIEKDSTKTWVAVPQSNISVGNEISCRPGMVMYNFPSTALNRIFKEIVFSGGITSSSGAADQTAEIQETDEEPEEPKVKKPVDDWKGGF